MKIHSLFKIHNRTRKIPVFAFLALVTIAMASCSIKMTRLGSVDKADKSITIPTGADDFMTTLKVCLTQEGWRIENFAGPQITEKTTSTSLKYDSFNTRYLLRGQYKRVDDYAIPRLEYANFSLVDVKSRNEVALFAAGEVTYSSFCEKLAPHLKELEQ